MTEAYSLLNRAKYCLAHGWTAAAIDALGRAYKILESM